MNSGAERAAIERQLERIVASSGFARADRLSHFLRFIVEQAVQGKAHELKESMIGVAVYRRRPDYDPKADPTVRVEAGKLRVRLQEYYRAAGRADPILIDLPKGRYVPTFAKSAARPSLGRMWLAAAAVILAVAAGFVVWKRSSSGRPAPSIAVLPFVNYSADPADEYFSDGITEEIIHSLASVEGLRVISRTSSFAFKGKRPELRDVRAKLKVDHVVEGSVRKSGETLRITAQLIRVADDSQLWSSTYNREMKDVLAIQEEIARDVVATLRVKLARSGRPLRKRQTENLEAYNLYLKGRYFWDKWQPETTWKALDYFQQAIAKDPKYALAHAGVAYSYQRLLSAQGSGGVPIPDGSDKMRAAAEKALQFDPLLPEAHAVLGMYNHRRSAWSEAEKSFRRALEIDPDNVLARRWYGMALAEAGRSEDGVREVRRSLELDPLSPDAHSTLAEALLGAGRHDEAIASCQKALELDPNFPRAHWTLGRIYVQKGMYSEGIQELLISEKAMGREEWSPWLGYAYAVAGRKPEALRILDRNLERSKGGLWFAGAAMVYAGLGDKDRALEWLGKAPRFSASTPEWNSLRSDPRFGALVRKRAGQCGSATVFLFEGLSSVSCASASRSASISAWLAW